MDEPGPDGKQAWRILWTFSQLKNAALLTLDIQRIASDHVMGLKDASAYNIQCYGGRPIFIDTHSFETNIEGRPWVAYRQFCQHFLAPLALIPKRDVRSGQLLRVHIDGIPLDLASALMPRRTWLILGLAGHLHLHARAQKAFSKTDKELSTKGKRLSQLGRSGLIGIVQSLRSTVEKLHWKAAGTEWSDYHHATNFSAADLEDKKRLVSFFFDGTAPNIVWDLGANNGLFSRLASGRFLQRFRMLSGLMAIAASEKVVPMNNPRQPVDQLVALPIYQKSCHFKLLRLDIGINSEEKGLKP